MTATITALTADHSVDQLVDLVEDIEQRESEMRAEHGMGAVSMGFDPYEIPPYRPSDQTLAFLAEARARITDAHPPQPVVLVATGPDGLPF